MPLHPIADLDDLFPGLSGVPVELHDLGQIWGDSGTADTTRLLCRLARSGHVPVIEFGTFRGRTTYHLALNSVGPIHTVDIARPVPEEVHENVERKTYPAYTPGELFRSADSSIRGKITQWLGDSRTLNLAPLHAQAGLVYVDGGHSYEVCLADSHAAFRLVRPGGVVVWDDYGDYWPGVRRAVDELAARRNLYVLRRLGVVIYREPPG